MAHLGLSLLLLLLSVSCISATVDSARFARSSPAGAHIATACSSTRYPALCIQYLSVFAESRIHTPQQLAHAALSVSLYRALQTKSYLSKVARELKAKKSKDYQSVKDCSDQINDSVGQLSQSIIELHSLERLAAVGSDVFWRVSNIETWVSSALTDASTCIDAFPGRNMNKLKATIKAKVLNVEQTASNALALFHQYASKYKP